MDTYEAGAIPTHCLIDKQGNFAKETKIASPNNEKQLIAQIEKLLK